VGQTGEDIAEIIKGIDAPATAGFDDGVENSRTLPSLGIPDEEPFCFARL
jgi:hypothetical protein